MLTTEQAMATGATLPAFSLSPLQSFVSSLFAGKPSWSGVPQQHTGSAAGHGHTAAAAQTKANRGAGHAPGAGKGELPEVKPYARNFKTGASATAVKGYDPATSKRNAAKSTADTDYFDNADGTFSRRVAQQKTNFQDASGAWQPVNTNVAKAGDGRFHEAANNLSVDFAPQAADGALASFGVDPAHGLSYGLKGAAQVTGTASGSTVTYAGVLPDTDLMVAPISEGLKESVVLHSAQAANSWVFPLNLTGLTPSLNTAGGVDLKDSSGKVVETIPAAYAYDSKIAPVSGERGTTHDVTYQLITDGGKPALQMTLSAAWLHDKARSFPVTVDPSIWDFVNTTYAESGSDTPQVDHSMEQTIKVGSWDSGPHSANSFEQDWYHTFDGSGVSLVSAHLWLYDIWASTCTPETFNVSQITQPWTPSSVTSYPGPSFGSPIGTLTPTVSKACVNNSGSTTGGDQLVVPLNTAAMQNLANGTTPDYGLAISAPTNDNLHWKQFGSMADPGAAPYVVYDYTGNVPPQVEATYPQNGNTTDTLTPQLQAFADDSQVLSSALKYDFQVYDGSNNKLADSGLVSGGGWTVPSGTLKWGQSYYWTVQANNGTQYSPAAPYSELSVQVPQPAITSSLSQNGDANGFDPATGNFTKSVTDAEVSTSGPSLDVVRDYNSRDYRTNGAFGSGWSSILDARATERKDASGNLTGVVVTYPDGSQVGFGKSADGTFAAPAGRFATLRAITGGYTLTDKNDTVYTFTQSLGTGAYGIYSVADANTRAIYFYWTAGEVTGIASAVSNRSLHFNWSTPTGAGSPHVSSVYTDPVVAGNWSTALTWTYSYTGDQLTKLCSPTDTTSCSQYSYTPGSQFQTQVLDAGASSLWPLNETSGAANAASAVNTNEGADKATYNTVTLGQAGPLAGSTATAAGFNGSSSYIEIPKSLASSSSQYTMSMWFKTTSTTPGVLFSYSTLPLSSGTTAAQFTPSIYLDAHGRINAEFWNTSGVAPIVSGAVNDGNWHQVVLAGAGSSQTLYLDGSQVGQPLSGMIGRSGGYTSALQGHTYIGAGFLGGTWPDEPHYSTTINTGYATYFNGTIAQVAAFPKGLTATQVAAQYTAGKQAGTLLTGITRPSGKQFATVGYDTNTAQVTQVTDENGGVWQIGKPSVAGSSQVYRSAVMGAAPAGYWRLGDTAGASNAYDEVKYGTGTYNAATLGSGGPFADATAAKFNGSSSYVQLPSTDTVGTGPNSVEMWFNMPAGNTAGGVLFDYAGASLTGGSPRGNSWVPALYVGTDGKLHGKFWDQYTTAWQIVTPSTVNDGKWHHVVLSASATSQSMYLDGSLTGTTLGTRTVSPSTYVYVGAGESSSWPNGPTNTEGYFPGSISDVAFYRAQLTAADAAQHFQAGQNSAGLSPLETVNVVDPGGKTLVHQYDPNAGNHQVAEIDGGGNKTSYGYDSGGFLHTTTDPDGDVTTTGHDVRGNTVSVTGCQNQAAGVCSTKYYSYWPDDTTATLTTADPRNDVLLTVRDGRSSSATDNTYLTSYTYDASGNKISTTTPPVAGFPNGRTTTTTYSDGSANFPATDTGTVPLGLPVKTTSPGGAVNSIAYLHSGDVASTTDPAGLKTSYTYDGQGRPLTKTVVSDTYPAGLTTAYAYDGLSQVVKETNPPITDRVTGAIHSSVSSTVFDADGNITSQSVTDATGGDSPRTESTTYNQYDQVASRTDANGNAGAANGATTTSTYDSSGNLLQETNPAGVVTAYTYDSNGHLLTQSVLGITGDPTNPTAPATVVESSRAYDPAGRLASVTDAMGNTTAYTYTDDGLTATVTKTDSNGANPFVLQSDLYDAAGNLTQRTSSNGATVTQYQVDAASRTTGTTIDPTGVDRTTSMSYTPDDLIATSNEHDSSGWDRTTSSTYDGAGRTLSQTLYGDASGHPNGWWPLSQTSGSTVTDATGTGNTASANGPVTWSNSAATFNGSDWLATNGPVINTASSYTVSAWANLADTSSDHTIVAQGGKNTEAFYLQYSKALNTWAFVSPSADATSGVSYPEAAGTSPATTNTWTHLVGVYDGSAGTMTLYVNGTAAATTSNASAWNATGPLSIGNAVLSGGGQLYGTGDSGSVANVQVYQRALSATEAAGLYSSGRGGGTVGSSGQQTTNYTYDQRGLTTSMTDANGNTTNYVNDEAGNRTITSAPTVSVETAGGTPAPSHPTTTSGFNTFGEEVEQLDPNGNEVTHTYDANGEETSSTDPSYTPPGSSTPITATTTQTYDALGDVITATRADGKSSSYLFDQRGELAQETTPDGNKTHYTYDTNGDKLSVTDASGAVHQATYDYMGREITSSTLERYPTAQTLTETSSYAVSSGNPYGAFLSSQTSADGRTTSYGYNRAGDLASTTDPAGNTTSYAYDFMGNRQKTTAPDGSMTETDYNASGQPALTKQYSSGPLPFLLAQSSQTYDGVGNVLSSTDARNNTSTFTYDATGMVTNEIQPVSATSSITTSFGYDAKGERTRFTDGRGNSWKYTYNSWGKPESSIAPTTATYTAASDGTTGYVYDQLGRLTQVNQPGGVVNTMTYDVSGNLTSQSGSGAEAATATRNFTYDPLGQVLTAQTTAAGTAGQTGYQAATSESFGYDDRGDLLSASGTAGTSSFGYTKDGLLASRTDAAGTTSYTYDNGGRLATMNDPATGNTLTYGYNSLSQPTSISYGASGQTRAFSYDPMHRLTGDTLTSGSTTLASIAYGYDQDSNLASKTTTGVTGASANTYTYDYANRLSSWNNGTTNTAYSYDASGNRIQVGSNVFTYDERDQLTSDGTQTYRYSARGTMTEDRTGGTPAVYASDAYGQQIIAGQDTYTLDASGRVMTSVGTGGGGNRTFQYTGGGNQLASDGTNTYTWDAAGGLVGTNTPGGTTATGHTVMTDQHDDVVGQFGSGSTALTGSQTYDPLGNVTATAGLVGQLGYQSGWTDSANGKVNMGSRWYNPADGVFLNKDTVSNNPTPNSAAANPFAYVDDNPMIGTDPSGHCSWWTGSCEVQAAKAAAERVASAARAAAQWAAQQAAAAAAWAAEQARAAIAAAAAAAAAIAAAAQRAAAAAASRIVDMGRRVYQAAKRVYRYSVKTVRRVVHTVVHAVHTAYHAVAKAVKHVATVVKKAAKAVGHAVAKAAVATASYVKHHAAAITSFVVSTAVFAGCEAATAGVGTIGCSALSGAAGALVDQGFKCASGGGKACSAGAFGKSALVGGAEAALGDGLGALGGKLLGKIGPKALDAAGGLFGKGASEVADAGAQDATAVATHETTSEASQSATQGATCKTGPHSFTGNTPVLLADNTTKPISQIKIGDQITNSVPGKDGTETHTVTNVIVTTTDHDFVNLTITPTKTDSSSTASKAGKALLGLAAGVAALTLWAAPAQPAQAAEPSAATSTTAPATQAKAPASADDVQTDGSTLTTTYHHPFYDETQHAFVEAQYLNPGDVLQTPTGTATVATTHLFHADTTTYDLTIGDLHTYYVEAGSTPVLVHNISLPCPSELQAGLEKAKNASSSFDRPGGMSGHAQLSDGASHDLSSGGDGRNLRSDWEAPPGTTDENFHHLENQTAALMRKSGSDEAYLYLHKAQGAAYGACKYCVSAMREMLPQGSKLMVIWQNEEGAIKNRVFIGAAD
ncbi:LamG-like jellyroll fold domain-containing protein [Kitasatospora mediocidica]|uniref:LamG-like jellyroll fold domain-containing protein n=1 Tax=Kitasatospora mediocidica TaxID=58352 RepID=UPI000A9332D0|nr:LamG-like jellyroll fold domain-containing protein [Kitasatospora mediocidica]